MPKIENMPVDHLLREMVPCGSDAFPMQYNVDDLSQWNDQTVPLHWHPEVEIFSVNSGTVNAQIGSEHILLSEGETILIKGNLLHSYTRITEAPDCICPNILFSGTLIAPVSSDIYNKYLFPILYHSARRYP